MKRPKLKVSLARLQAETIRNAKEGQSSKAPKAPDQKMVDRRVVWHHWSDGHRSLHPYRSASLSAAPSAALVIGDADLSFSRALMEIIDPEQIIATVWEDDEEELVRKYPIVAPLNLAAIRDSSTRLLWGIDATKLSLKYLAGKMDCLLDQVPRFTRIVFNFPHTGEGIKDRGQNIKAQQRLISAFLQAATNLLKEQASCPLGYTQEEVTRKTLMAAPPSTDAVISVPEDVFVAKSPQPEVHLTCWTGDPYDDWEVKKIAATAKNLSLLESFVFTGDRYPGYQHCRTIGFVPNDETFLHRPARTFVFVQGQNDKSLKRAPSGKKQKVKSHKRGPLDRHPKDKSSKRGSLDSSRCKVAFDLDSRGGRMLGLTATLAASGEFKSRGSLETLTLNSRHSHTFFQEAPATGISTLHKLAAKGLLSEYLCAFRVLCNPQQAHPSVAILVEHLTICYNAFDLRMIEFTDVEVLLERLARDASEDADLVQVCVEVYFMNIRVQLDGKEAAHGKLERFLSGASLPGSQRQHWLTVAMGSALIVTLGAVIVSTKFLNSRLY